MASPRQLEVLKLSVTGLADKEIADRMGLQLGSVHKHMERLYKKIGAHTRAQAVWMLREQLGFSEQTPSPSSISP